MAKYFSMDGYVCGKIETRSTGNGKCVTSFSINSPERRRIGDEWTTVPQFFSCQYWHRGDHDYRAPFIVDGAHLQLSGEPRFEEWQGKNGKRSAIRFNANNLFLIAPKGASAVQNDDEIVEESSDTASIYDIDIPF